MVYVPDPSAWGLICAGGMCLQPQKSPCFWEAPWQLPAALGDSKLEVCDRASMWTELGITGSLWGGYVLPLWDMLPLQGVLPLKCPPWSLRGTGPAQEVQKVGIVLGT